MARLRVNIDIDDTGYCVASMDFRNQEIEGEGDSPSAALQSLAEILALHEDEIDPDEELSRMRF